MNPYPTKEIISLADFTSLPPADLLIQRKYDGEVVTLPLLLPGGHSVEFICEKMRPKSGGFFTTKDRSWFDAFGEWFAVLTLANLDGENMLEASNDERWETCERLQLSFPRNWTLAETCRDGDVAGFVDLAMDSGAEGVVAHPRSTIWGPMLCHKAGWMGVCRVTGHNGDVDSVFIEDAETGAPRGKVALHGKVVEVGALVRVEGLCLTADGKIRQPQLCREWKL